MTAISNVSDAGKPVRTEYYNLQGVRVPPSAKGTVIRVTTLDNGRRISKMIINK